MPTNILVQVPDSLREYHDKLLDFFNGMIKKLDKNCHKDTPSIQDMGRIIDLLQMEVQEFEEQLVTNKYDENSLIELMDTANFAFLAYVALRLQGVEHAKEAGNPKPR